MSRGFVTTTREGTLLNLHVSPGAKRTSIEGLYGEGAIRLNAEVERFLSKLLGVTRSDVTVIQGSSSRDKTILVRSVSQTRTHQALSAYLP